MNGDIGSADFEMPGSKLSADVSTRRLSDRRSLIEKLQSRCPAQEAFDANYRTASELLHNRAGDIRRILGQHLAPPEMVKGARKALVVLRAEALALSKELG